MAGGRAGVPAAADRRALPAGRAGARGGWDDTTPARTTEGGCSGPLGTVDGATSRNYNTGGGGAIPDRDWDRVVEVVREVVEPEGYDRFAVIVDQPAQHSLSFYPATPSS